MRKSIQTAFNRFILYTPFISKMKGMNLLYGTARIYAAVFGSALSHICENSRAMTCRHSPTVISLKGKQVKSLKGYKVLARRKPT